MDGQVINLIKAALVPFVLISGEGLIALTMQNRYGRVIDRVRELHHRLKIGEEVRKEEFNVLYKRGLLLRNSMICLFSSIMFCLLTSIITYWTGGSILSFVFFLFSLLLFFIGVLLAVIDLLVSYKALEIRIKSSLKE
ncbi:MAG: DUF2721 domain-containing protein [Candidatus Aminicenantes bacterium]|nr:DUF2721 domain-containing protein [Candidatus Aminicenantes bacterium]